MGVLRVGGDREDLGVELAEVVEGSVEGEDPERMEGKGEVRLVDGRCCWRGREDSLGRADETERVGRRDERGMKGKEGEDGMSSSSTKGEGQKREQLCLRPVHGVEEEYEPLSSVVLEGDVVEGSLSNGSSLVKKEKEEGRR